MERRSLMDDDMTPTREMGDVFGDEFEVDDFDVGVADGFRPSDHDREGDVRRAAALEDQPVQTAPARLASTHASSFTPTGLLRNSIRKLRNAEDPFASPDDDTERTPSLSFEPDLAHRSVSSASSHHFARTGSPRFGAGPSHPYGMYPQGTIPRSPSVATSSTARQFQRQPSVRNGPQHPYALYPQGVDEDSDDDDDEVDVRTQNPTTVGFPGLGQSYRRRLGPDGEEQDIVGEDGHTEQLPPYTRYPEDGPEKIPLLGVPAPPTALHSRAPVAGTDPTMDLMHNAIHPLPAPAPAPQSMTDTSRLVRQTSERAVGDANLHRDTFSNKSWSEKSWKEKRKTRFCGIPFWWILLSLSVTAFIAAVLGGVIGGFVKHQERGHRPMTTSTALYDASAIATPAISPPTGTYALSLSTPQQIQDQCLTQSDQRAAWSCNLAGDQNGAAINVGVASQGNRTGAYIYYNSADQEIYYGAQLSWMHSSFAPFLTVQDNDAPTSGPAYYFQQFYDKLVVVPEAAIQPPQNNKNNNNNNKVKRQGIQLDQGWLQRKQVAQAGDKPWFCVWNNTFVEGFIYVQEPIVTVPSPSLVGSNSSMTAPSTTGLSASGSTSGASSNPALTVQTTTITGPTTTATYTFTSPVSRYSAFASQKASKASGSNRNKRHQDTAKDLDDEGDDADSKLALYPYVVKIEERRLTGNTVQPYCQQYQILDDGSYNWVAQSDGSTPIIVYLDESDPSPSAYKNNGAPDGCHCQWMSGQSG